MDHLLLTNLISFAQANFDLLFEVFLIKLSDSSHQSLHVFFLIGVNNRSCMTSHMLFMTFNLNAKTHTSSLGSSEKKVKNHMRLL